MKLKSLIVVGMTILAAGLGPVAQAAPALSPPAANAKLKQAMLTSEDTGAEPPRLSDPAWAPTIRAAYDLESLGALPGLDLGAVLEFCSPAGGTMVMYWLHGLKRSGLIKAEQAQSKTGLLRLQSENLLRYQDELTLGMRFSARCFAAGIPAIRAFWRDLRPEERTDARREGLVKLRRDMTQVLFGAMLAQNDALRPENKAMLLDAAARSSSAYAGILPPADRQPILERAKAGLATASNPETRAAYQAIIKAMTDTPCDELCSL